MKTILSILFTLFITIQLNAQEAFIWNDDEDYKPFIYKDEHGKAQGIFKDIMVEAFKRMHIPLKYQLYAWKRAQQHVKDKQADGMVTVPTPERLKFLKPSDTIIIAKERIFARKDNPKIKQIMKIKSINEFKNYKVVDYIGAGWAQDHYKNLKNVIWVPKNTNALLMVANKRADIYLSDEFIGVNTIKKLIKQYPQYKENLKKLIICPHVFAKLNFSLLIRKDSKFVNIIPKFNKVLKEMKEDGTYNKILKKYLSIKETDENHN